MFVVHYIDKHVQIAYCSVAVHTCTLLVTIYILSVFVSVSVSELYCLFSLCLCDSLRFFVLPSSTGYEPCVLNLTQTSVLQSITFQPPKFLQTSHKSSTLLLQSTCHQKSRLYLSFLQFSEVPNDFWLPLVLYSHLLHSHQEFHPRCTANIRFLRIFLHSHPDFHPRWTSNIRFSTDFSSLANSSSLLHHVFIQHSLPHQPGPYPYWRQFPVLECCYGDVFQGSWGRICFEGYNCA